MDDCKLSIILSTPYGSLNYLQDLWSRFYSFHSPSDIKKKLQAIKLPNGICGRKFGQYEYGWYCKDCQKDNGCIICTDCFERGNHRGHRVYLRRNPTGCCDCGDHESWDTKGFCSNHQGFIREDVADTSLLPSEIINSSKETISDLCTRLFSICSSLITKYDPNFDKEIRAIIETLNEISEINPIFLYEVFRNISKERTEAVDPVIGIYKLEYKMNIIDATIILFKHLNELLKELIKEFYVNGIKSYSFKESLGESYMKNYTHVMLDHGPTAGNNASVLGVQVLNCENLNSKYATNKHCVTNFITGLKAQTLEFVSNPTSNNYYLFLRCKYDLFRLTKKSSIVPLLNTSLLPSLIELSTKVCYMRLLVNIESHIPYEVPSIVNALSFERFLLKMYEKLASSGNYNDEQWCKNMALTFKQYVKELYKSSNISGASFFNILFYRCLSFFLVNYISVHVMLYYAKAVKEELNLCIRRLLKDLFEFSNDSEYNDFARMIMYPVLKTIGFMLEVTVGKWVQYGNDIKALLKSYMSLALRLPRHDIALLQIMLASYAQESGEKIFLYLIESLSQGDKWLDFYISQLLDTSQSMEDIEETLEEKEIDKEKLNNVLEQALFFLCGLCSNDFFGLPIFFKAIKPKLVKQPYYHELKDNIDYIETQAIRKELVHAYFKCNDLWISIPNLLEHLPKCYQKSTKLESIVKELFETLKDPTKNTETYKLKPAFLKEYNPYFYLFQSNTGNYEEKISETFKKHSQNFNPLFGISNGQTCSYWIIQNLIKGGMPKVLQGLIDRCLTEDAITDNAKLSILKLIKIGKLDTKNTEELCKLLGEKMPQYKFLLMNGKGSMKERSEEVKLKTVADLKREEVMRAFKAKSETFANKNKEALQQVEVSSDLIECAICKKSLSADKFIEAPYGKLVYISVSGVYGNFLRQLVKEEDKKRVNEASNLHTRDIVIQSCDHYIHYKCMIDSEEGKLLEHCPICKSPVAYLIPPVNCLRKMKVEEKKKLSMVTDVLKVIKEKYAMSDKEVIEWIHFVAILSNISCYKIRKSELREFQDFSVKEWEPIHALFLITEVFKSSEESERYTSETMLEAIVDKVKENNDLASQDLLKYFSYILSILLQSKELDKVRKANELLLFFLKLHLWQILIKLSIDFKTPFRDFSNLIKQQSRAIRELMLLWMMKALYLKVALLELERIEETKHKVTNNFDSVMRLLGYTKEELIESLLSNGICYEGIELTVEEIKDLIKEIPTKEVPMQILTIFNKKSFSFIELEDDYMELQMAHYKRKCKNCKKQVLSSSICLLCGEIVCYNNMCCENELIHHAKTCSEGTGIFLYFSRNQIILVSRSKSVVYTSPYKDKYGVSIDTSKVTFEPIKLNTRMLNELKENYLKDRINDLVENLTHKHN